MILIIDTAENKMWVGDVGIRSVGISTLHWPSGLPDGTPSFLQHVRPEWSVTNAQLISRRWRKNKLPSFPHIPGLRKDKICVMLFIFGRSDLNIWVSRAGKKIS